MQAHLCWHVVGVVSRASTGGIWLVMAIVAMLAIALVHARVHQNFLLWSCVKPTLGSPV